MKKLLTSLIALTVMSFCSFAGEIKSLAIPSYYSRDPGLHNLVQITDNSESSVILDVVNNPNLVVYYDSLFDEVIIKYNDIWIELYDTDLNLTAEAVYGILYQLSIYHDCEEIEYINIKSYN